VSALVYLVAFGAIVVVTVVGIAIEDLRFERRKKRETRVVFDRSVFSERGAQLRRRLV